MALFLSINGDAAPASAGSSLFDFAERRGIAIPTSCRKQGKCKECIVEVTSGIEDVSPPTAAEMHLKGNFRLACQACVASESGYIECHTMHRGELRIERQAFELPTRGDSVKIDAAVTRCGKQILIDGAPVAESADRIHGLAMDLGTTTVVLRLIDLETGEVVADASFENPQRFAGSEVMARIQYDTDHPGRVLMRVVAGYVSRAIEAFPVDPHSIYELVVVGNATMRDLFFRQSVYSIGQSPYQSLSEIELAAGKRSTTSLFDTGKGCLLPIHPRARVYGAPVVSGHVGADAAACMLAVDLAHEDRLVAIMDVGTNTELIIGNRERIVAASCPAGPAFEGGGIAHGMPGLCGAIERVHLREDGEFQTVVIGDQAPVGICGSGLVELLSELLRCHEMNQMGRFTRADDPIEIDPLHGICLSESDINELAQAKGANMAGLQIAFHQFGIDFGDIDVFYLAGGFGRHVNIAAARRIGLIPNLPDHKIVQAGNAAIEGASLALVNRHCREELEQLVRRVEHCRLETHPQFFDFFVESCQFKPFDSVCEAVG